MDWLSWALLIVAVVIGCGIIAWKIVQVVRMTPEQRKETVKQWLISAVVAAEAAIKESGAGKEKMEMVKNYFSKNSPVVYKIMMSWTKDLNLEELIEEALTMVKDNFNGK